MDVYAAQKMFGRGRKFDRIDLTVKPGRTIAEAGFEDAMLQLRLNSSWRAGFTNKAFSGGSYTVTLSSGTPAIVTSVGSAPAMMILGTAQATITGQALVQASTSSSSCTTYSNSVATVNGLADTYDSSVSTNPASFNAGGHFCSNDNFQTANGAIRVRMDVDYFSTVGPKAGTVEGTVTHTTFTYTVPTHNDTAFANNNDDGKLPNTYFTAASKTLSIPINAIMTISSGTYYFNSMTVNGNLQVDTSLGPVYLCMTADFTLPNKAGGHNGEITNLSSIPSKLMFYPQGGAGITLSSKAPLYAIVNAAASNVTVSQTLYGNIIGNNVTINSGNIFHFDQQTALSSSSTAAHVSWSTGTWTSTP